LIFIGGLFYEKQINKKILFFLFLTLIFFWGCNAASPVNPPPSTPPEDAILVSITVLPETMTLSVGDSQKLTSITASYDIAADTTIPLADCSYSSDNPGVATVANGTITGVSTGSATITISYTEGAITQTDTIEVSVLITGIILYPVHNITQNKSYFAIQDALDDAKNGDTIQVKDGTYQESLTFPSGKIIVLESVNGSSSTVIQGLNGQYAISCNGSQKGTDIRGFTITHQAGEKGAGVYNTNGWIKLTGCHILNNASDENGGGIRNLNATITVNGCTVSGNSAPTSGGGILNDNGTLNLDNKSIISYNSTQYGGGICNYHGNTAIIGETSVIQNTATESGGGITNDGGTTTITGKSSVSENRANGHYGGGIYMDHGTVNVTGGSIVSKNYAAGTGGGIYNFHGTLEISASNVSENVSSWSGGGLAMFVAETTISESSISENNAAFAGGGIDLSSSIFKITGSTISENNADVMGGGIYRYQSSPVVPDIIGGSSNHFINNKKNGIISSDHHIVYTYSDGDVHGNFPYNYYTPN